MKTALYKGNRKIISVFLTNRQHFNLVNQSFPTDISRQYHTRIKARNLRGNSSSLVIAVRSARVSIFEFALIKLLHFVFLENKN